jgi:hypothetical protein
MSHSSGASGSVGVGPRLFSFLLAGARAEQKCVPVDAAALFPRLALETEPAHPSVDSRRGKLRHAMLLEQVMHDVLLWVA